MNDLDQIVENRLCGFDEGTLYLKEHGLELTMIEAKRISDNQTPTLQEYGYIDGFMNAIASQL